MEITEAKKGDRKYWKNASIVWKKRRLNRGLDEEDHATFNRESPVYQNRLMLRKRRIGLAI